MRLAKHLILVFCVLACWSFVPPVHQVEVVLEYNGKPFELNDSSFSCNGEPIVFTSLKFYLGQFEFRKSDKQVYRHQGFLRKQGDGYVADDGYHLVDAEYDSTRFILLRKPFNTRFKTLRFCLGVDSATSSSGAMSGDLDPTKGMFWAWNSGYINFKLEGTHPHCPTRKNQFIFHIGGYATPYATLQTLEVKSRKYSTKVVIDIADFLKGIDLKTENHVMSPGSGAVKLAKRSAHMFKNAIE